MSETSPGPGRFLRAELLTPDLGAAARFYSALFPEWQVDLQHASAGQSAPILLGAREIGRMGNAAPGEAAHWIADVTVADVDEATRKAEALDGRVVSRASDIPHLGRRAVVSDPEGACLGLLHAEEEPPEHFGPMPGGAFCWLELLAKKPATAATFYPALTGWSHAEVPGPMGAYHLFRRGDRDSAGLLPMPQEAPGPSMWLVYIYTKDLEAAQARIRELGGAIYRPTTALAGIGQLAVVADPQGAMFCLFRSERG